MDNFYRACFNNFGPNDTRTLGWNGSGNQEKRFNKLLKIGIREGDSVLDVGCGFGDLYFYCLRYVGDIRYVGVEKNFEISKVAKSNLRDRENASVVNIDFEEYLSRPDIDWVVCSGLFPFDFEDYDICLDRYIKKMLSISRRGVALNLLSTKSKKYEQSFKYNSPGFVISRVEKISKKFNLFHDYLDNDFTVHIYNE